jgi:hypothetical protein
MSIYTIKGVVKDPQNKPIENVMVQAMESDQIWYEDHSDDLIDSKWVNKDGTFEFSFGKERFKDNILEGNPDLYLIIRNSFGQIIHQTEIRRGVNSSDNKNLYFDIILNSTEKQTTQIASDPYISNNERVLAAFQRLGDVSEFQLNDILRIFRLLITSINAWSLYTTEHMWNVIGYDGPQVPRYPWREHGHSHKLSWEGEEERKK